MTKNLVALMVATGLVIGSGSSAQHLRSADEYVFRVGRGAKVSPAREPLLNDPRLVCDRWPAVIDPNLDDFAASEPGFIIVRPDVFNVLPAPVRLWIFHHECGHLRGIRDEAEADCFSVRRGKAEGWLTAQGLEEVCRFISRGRADAAHPSGADRCAMIRGCFKAVGTATGPRPSRPAAARTPDAR